MAFINKHSKGDWQILGQGFYLKDEDNNEIECSNIHDGDGAEIVFVTFDNVSLEEGEANMKLIAASPKLRQLVEMFYDTLDDGFVKDLCRKTLIEAGVEITNLKQLEK